MRDTGRRATAVTSVALAGFMVFVLTSSSLALAAPAPSTAHPSSWAYGGVKSVSVGPAIARDGWVYQGNATIGYSVVLAQANTTAGIEVFANRTVGVSFAVKFCLPSCKDPTSYAMLSFREWETSRSVVNFTTQGTVNESGNAVAALALINSTTIVHANLTESASSLLPPALGSGPAVLREKYLAADVSGQASVAFSPDLGLIPLQLGSAPQQWSSESAFQATGTTDYAYYFSSLGPLANTTLGPISGHWSASPSGNVTVVGSYSPDATITFGGTTYPVLQIAVSGPFAVGEGFIFIPSQADLFGGESQPWGGNESGAATAEMSYLDAKPFEGGHLGIAASNWAYTSDALNPADAILSSGGLLPATTAPPSTVTSTSVQGAPYSPDQAQSSSNCLISGSGCPLPFGNLDLRGLLTSALAVGAVVAVVASIGTVLVAERRRMPPPVYPNARYYPPGAAVGPRAVTAPPTPTNPPPAPEEDPLDHLW